jgi:hypothetical protein
VVSKATARPVTTSYAFQTAFHYFPAPTNTSSLHLADYRYGAQTDQVVNWSVYPLRLPTSFGNVGAAHYTLCAMSHLTGGALAFGANCAGVGLVESAPGYSIGNPAVAPGSFPPYASLWSSGRAFSPAVLSYTSGIFGANGATLTHTAPGDTINYFYAYSNNGATAASDEGVKALAADTYENSYAYLGTLTSSTGAGLTSIKATIPVSGNSGTQGQGQYMIDQSTLAEMAHGHVTAVALGLVSPVNAVTIDGTVPISTGWGTLGSNVQPPIITTPPFTTSETITVNVTAPSTFSSGTLTLICFASQFHECSIPTSVSVTGSVATIVIPLRRPHAAGTLVGPAFEVSAGRVWFDRCSHIVRWGPFPMGRRRVSFTARCISKA